MICNMMYRGIVLIASMYEIWLCYHLFYKAAGRNKEQNPRWCILICGNILIQGMVLTVSRSTDFSDYLMLIFSITCTFSCLSVVWKRDYGFIMGAVVSYYAGLMLSDLFCGFAVMKILKLGFAEAVLTPGLSIWECTIYLVSRILVTVGFHLLKKTDFYRDIQRYTVVLLWFGIGCSILSWFYRNILFGMGLHNMRMDSAGAGFTMVMLVWLIWLIAQVIMEYQKLRAENHFLVFRDELMEGRYREMAEMLEENRRITHDTKNHLILLKEYEKQGELKKMGQYLDKIIPEYVPAESIEWTKNNTLDLILNQKKSESKKRKIQFSVEADILQNLQLQEKEICSLFGNLLDNAIEACERMKNGEKWIRVKIRQQKMMFFIEISNSVDRCPIQKNGQWLSSKSDSKTHGYGLKNVEHIVDEYDGVISYKAEKYKFEVTISFFSHIFY